MILEGKHMTATKKVIALSIAAVLVAGVSGVYAKGLFDTSNKTQTKLPDISVVEKGDLSKRVTASGTTVAADPVSIFIELSQEVEEVFAEVLQEAGVIVSCMEVKDLLDQGEDFECHEKFDYIVAVGVV